MRLVVGILSRYPWIPLYIQGQAKEFCTEEGERISYALASRASLLYRLVGL